MLKESIGYFGGSVGFPAVDDPVPAARVAVANAGTIPDRGLYTVNLPDRTRLGELDEEFVHETRVGDVFQLGSSTWRVNAIEHDRVIVTPAPGAPARMPFCRCTGRSCRPMASAGRTMRCIARSPDGSARGIAALR